MRIVLLILLLTLQAAAQNPNKNLQRDGLENLKRNEEYRRSKAYRNSPLGKIEAKTSKQTSDSLKKWKKDDKALRESIQNMPEPRYPGQPNQEPRKEILRTAAPTRSPLHSAAAQGNFDKVRELVEGGANATEADSAGDTALHLAAAKGDWRSVEYLLGKGADSALRNALGETPLHRAAKVGALEVAEALLKSGSPVNVKDNRGNTPLDLARKCTQGSARQLQATLEKSLSHGIE